MPVERNRAPSNRPTAELYCAVAGVGTGVAAAIQSFHLIEARSCWSVTLGSHAGEVTSLQAGKPGKGV